MHCSTAVRARGLTKVFGDVVALDGIDLDVAAGQVHGLVGPNGAGKTTLLGLLLGLAVADGGTLEVLGTTLGRVLSVPDGVAGFVDGPGLYPSLTARQNLAALVALRGGSRRDDAAARALAQVGLTDVADDRVRGFSLGMRQRLGLAAALITRPRLLVLDEPANGLDPAGKRQVHDVITALAEDGVSVVMSSHRMDDLAALCAEVTILSAGRVLFTGPVEKLAAESGDLAYRLATSDPLAARRVAAGVPGLTLQPADDPRPSGSLVVRGAVAALDESGRPAGRRRGRGAGARSRRTSSGGGLPRPHRNGGARMTLTAPPELARPAALTAGYRFELVELVSTWRIRLVLLVCWLAPGGFVAIVSQQSSLPTDTVFGRWMHATGWSGSLVVLAFACRLGASPADLGRGRRRLRRRGPAQHLAAPAGRGALAAPHLRGQGAGQPDPAPAHGHRPRGLQHRRWSVRRREPSAGRPRRTPAEHGRGGRHGAARLAVRAGADARLRGRRPARLRGPRPLPHGPARPRGARRRDEPRPGAAGAGGGATGPAQQRLPRLARPVHRARAGRCAPHRDRRQPGLGGGGHGHGPPPVRTARLHRPGVRRRRAPRRHAGRAPARRPGRRGLRRRRRGQPGQRLGSREGEAWRPPSRPPSPTSTGCRPPSLNRPDVTEEQAGGHRRLRQGRLARGGPRPRQRLALRRVLAPARLAGGGLGDVPDSTSPPTGATSPTATAPRRSTASSWCAPRRGTRRTRSGRSTASSTCSPADGRTLMQVIRRRVEKTGRRRLRLTVATTLAVAVAGGGVAYGSTDIFGDHQVGTEYADGLQVSSNQMIKPIGERLVTEYGKFMGSAPSPDGRFLAVTSNDRSVALQVFDLSTYRLVWRVGTASGVDQRWTDASVGQEAPTFSPDGRVLWVSQKDAVTRFPVNADGSLGTPTKIALPAVGGRSALPGQSAYSADGTTLYVALNGQNRVLAIDPATGAARQSWAVGTAPRRLALVGTKLYVSNEGGRAARPGETTMDSYGTAVPADGHRGTSTTGTLSVIDTAAPGAAVRSIAVGLHPTALHAAGQALFVTNTNDDTVSVVNTRTDQVEQRIDTQPWPASEVGYQPNAVTLTDDGHLLVSLGRANAVAVYRYHGSPKAPVDFVGLLPTDYYPSEVATVGDRVVVTNTRGIDARGPEVKIDKGAGTTPATGHGTHSTTGSLTRFALPSDKEIRKQTATVFKQNGWGPGDTDVKTARGRKAKPVPVPRRIGDPSTIKYVFMIVKENRTYDQVYGDLPQGNGDASLAQFGEQVTPNQHALARQFGLYDNTYDIGTNSAEGHNWIMQGDNPEYTESSAGEYVRSYDTEEDVLGHQRSGFLWSSVLDTGRTARNFGEFLYTEGKPSGTWQQYYCATRGVDAGGDPAQAHHAGA
ncbi:ATP-binding cassette domain-containing protein [Nocardioides convexus]|uniref:ATP-binding cassette domain-containing protein n=1 Tax=Nocardioides convexus TaxID=2712224 RepID=UPI0024189CFF|nr:ATP-binding cassette domain-containing protein [Nocardioides convexus]